MTSVSRNSIVKQRRPAWHLFGGGAHAFSRRGMGNGEAVGPLLIQGWDAGDMYTASCLFDNSERPTYPIHIGPTSGCLPKSAEREPGPVTDLLSAVNDGGKPVAVHSRHLPGTATIG